MSEAIDTAHSHPPYVTIWAVLIVLLMVSLGFGYLGNPVLATVLILSVATAKALLVLAYLMHLKFEPLFVSMILIAGFICLGILMGVLLPDIVFVYGG